MIWLGVLLTIVAYANGQLTAATSIAPELRECYLDPELINRNNLPPTTMQVLIDIIQKIEDNPNVGMNLRELSASLLHTYRQDGIEFHQPDGLTSTSSNVLPYAPTFHSFHRHRLLVSRLIPNNLPVLANTTISSKLKCALHHMLSTTVDSRIRGDENNCNQLSQYRSLRTVRNINQDVEILNPQQLKSANRRKNGNMRQFNPKDDIEYTNYGGSPFEKQISGSSCPLLGGVVSSSWGAVSGGNLIAGIAAGAEIQQVPTVQLTKGSVLNYNDVQASVTNIFPATLSGDLAEAILIQGTERGSNTISIGLAGGWNSSQAHRHYMLNSGVNNEMTDPEIRGGNDGFILGNRVTQNSNVRLSQLLDMYYSSRNGVMDPQVRACNRRTLIQEILPTDRLVSETYAFAAALDTNLPLRGTIIGGLQALVANAVTNYQQYSNNNLNGNSCETDTNNLRMKTNLYIALDSSWQYQTVYPAISYLLDSIEVGKFGSSITLLSAFDGSVLINTTYSLADFHSEYTLARHQSFFTGVNLANSLSSIRLMMQESLRNESLRNYVGGNATVLLFMLNSGTIENNNNVLEQARLLNDTVPDLRLIFATAANQLDNLWNLVRDMHNDIKTITLNGAGTNVEIVMGSVLSRIRDFGRRVVNPLCGADFTAGTSGIRRFDDFIEPGYTNYYAVSANYFYTAHGNRRLRIVRSTVGSSNLRVCHSRSVQRPGGSNSTIVSVDDGAVLCEVIASSGNANVEIGLQNACDAYWTINSCPPLYISVQAESTAANPVSSAICNDVSACRFPYNIRYQVEIEDFGCFSGSAEVTASLVIILSAYIMTLF